MLHGKLYYLKVSHSYRVILILFSITFWLMAMLFRSQIRQLSLVETVSRLRGFEQVASLINNLSKSGL